MSWVNDFLMLSCEKFSPCIITLNSDNIFSSDVQLICNLPGHTVAFTSSNQRPTINNNKINIFIGSRQTVLNISEESVDLLGFSGINISLIKRGVVHKKRKYPQCSSCVVEPWEYNVLMGGLLPK